MSNQEILEKAIQKAIEGGWQDGHAIGQYTLEKNKRGTYGLRSVSDGWINVEAIIFNHDFAKALWGDGNTMTFLKKAVISNDGDNLTVDMNKHPVVLTNDWMTHLQNMVIAEDPIKYLGENL